MSLDLERVTRASQVTQTQEISRQEREQLATERFVHAWIKRLVYGNDLNSFGINLANKVVFSAYLDLVHLGMQDDAEILKEVAFEKAKEEQEKYLENKKQREVELVKLRQLQPISQDAQRKLTLKRLEQGASLINKYNGQLGEQEVALLKYYEYLCYVDARDLGILEDAPPFEIITSNPVGHDKEHSPSKKPWERQRKPKPLNSGLRDALILKRLARGVRLMNEYGDQLNEAGLELLKGMIFADYLNARKFNLKRKAKEILEGYNTEEEK